MICLLAILLMFSAQVEGPLAVPIAVEKGVAIEYIAHASFVILSPAGVSVVIDPFNGYSYSWLGYVFPGDIKADAVLISHPHYDHDASYYIGGDPLVLKRPGTYSIGDISIEGVEGRHADPRGQGFGRAFGDLNTIWVVEVEGVRIVHIGDNGPIEESVAKQLGHVDVLMVPIDAEEHLLRYEEVEAMLAILRPRVVVPMHYQIPTISEQPKDLGPIDPWLATRKNVRKLSSNELSLRRESLPVALETIVFLPSPAVKAWPASFLQARAKFDEADRTFKTNPEAVEALLRETVRLFPEGLEFWFVLGGNLATEGRMWEAIEALERGLLAGQRDEWGYQWRTRDRLAKLYEKVGEKELAIVQYRQIADSCPVIDLREEAVASLVRLQMK